MGLGLLGSKKWEKLGEIWVKMVEIWVQIG